MSVALSGLLLIQSYWIKNVYDITQAQLSEKVMNALESTAKDLEKVEATRFMHPDLYDQGLQGSYADFLNTEFGDVMHVDESIQIRDTAIVKDGETYRFLVVTGMSLDSATGVLTEQRIFAKNFNDLVNTGIEGSVLSLQDTNSIAIQLSNSYERQIVKKARFLNELTLNMFTNNYYDDIKLRLNLKVLDSLLYKNLFRFGLDTSFAYNVVDQKDVKVDFLTHSDHYNKTLQGAVYSSYLYPNDIVPSNYQIRIEFPSKKFYIWREMAGTLLASFLLALIIVIAFYLSVSTIYKQKQLSEIKNDFIGNMTHELKTPISTISLACEAINDPDVYSDKETIGSYIGMIDQENKRLAKLVEKVLQSSLFDKGKMRLSLTETKVHEILKEVVDAFQIRFKNKSGSIVIDQLDEIVWDVDRIHFSNILYNLLDNALKYCTNKPKVNIKLVALKKGFVIEIVDNGIGIKKEDQKKIFEKLYRVPTGDVHDVKGFGLGLNYVDGIVKLHHGKIYVKSALGKGSTFKINIGNE
ncbi:sensor histidine kinase [Crocinitomix catalasitica]|uniref:sensor histidine kinase n=1 Tax=Crocinitomix catalasitica TaxID=184607 RepID=UPI0004825689|nr:HAMP domain-containing sensor histidine kinase [Crocinitomix catalasitica]